MPLIYAQIAAVAVCLAILYKNGKFSASNSINVILSSSLSVGCLYLIASAIFGAEFLLEHFSSMRHLIFIAGLTSLIVFGNRLLKQIGIIKDS